MKQDRLFHAIGSADTPLLERSERASHVRKANIWVKWCLSAAACFLVIFSFLFINQK